MYNEWLLCKKAALYYKHCTDYFFPGFKKGWERPHYSNDVLHSISVISTRSGTVFVFFCIFKTGKIFKWTK